MRLLRPLLAAAKHSPYQSFNFRTGGYNKLGLKTDDLLWELLPEVKEAVRRLPEEVRNDRAFRLKRAVHLSMTHAILPQEEWTKPEEDDRYLMPLVTEVEKEIEEKANWGKD